MSDTVVVMDSGRIQQIGTPQDIYNEPENAFVADFIGESNIPVSYTHLGPVHEGEEHGTSGGEPSPTIVHQQRFQFREVAHIQ